MTRVLSITLVLCVIVAAAATAVEAQGVEVQGIRSERARGAEAIMDLLEQKDRGLTRREATLEAREADLRAADLTKADLRLTNFYGANLEAATFSFAVSDGYTIWPNDFDHIQAGVWEVSPWERRLY